MVLEPFRSELRASVPPNLIQSEDSLSLPIAAIKIIVYSGFQQLTFQLSFAAVSLCLTSKTLSETLGGSLQGHQADIFQSSHYLTAPQHCKPESLISPIPPTLDHALLAPVFISFPIKYCCSIRFYHCLCFGFWQATPVVACKANSIPALQPPSLALLKSRRVRGESGSELRDSCM